MPIDVRAVLSEPNMPGIALSDRKWQMYALPEPGTHYWHDRTGYTVDRIEDVEGETRVHLVRDPEWEVEVADGLNDDQAIIGGPQSDDGQWHFEVVDRAGHHHGWSFGNELEPTIREAVASWRAGGLSRIAEPGGPSFPS
jgi:hypothetical protein